MNFPFFKEDSERFETYKKALLKGDFAAVRDNMKKEYVERSLDVDEKRPIHVACESGNIDIVKLLIEKNVDIECETKRKWRPIHFVCLSGNIDIVKVLIEKNVDIECETWINQRPIHFACESGNFDIVKLLMEKNVDIVFKTNRKKKPIHFACYSGNIDIVKLLIEKNVDIECETNWKKRPIHFACERGNFDIVKLLIEKNVDIECVTRMNQRPIHFACLSGNIDIVKLLIEKNVDIECETNENQRPIHFACKSGNIDIVKQLIEKNVDIVCETNRKQRPIHLACYSGNIDIVKLLIEKNVDIECETNEGLTPLQIAKDLGHRSCVELLENIIKVNECAIQNKVSEFSEMYNYFICNYRMNYIDLFVMERAINNNCNSNSYQIIKLMMERNIDDAELTFLTNFLGVIEKRETIALMKECILYKCIRDHHAEGFHKYCLADTINGRHKIIESSFLEISAQHGSAAFIEKILKRSVYQEETWNRAIIEAEGRQYYTIVEDIKGRKQMIERRTRRHFSLLHTAVNDNDENMVEYILKEKIIDPNINHETFGTALAMAYSLSHTRCINVLQKYNVDTNTQNKFGETPLHEAIASGTLEQCEYLVERCNDIDKEGFNHLTALHCAVMEGCVDLCNQLIQKGADCARYVHFSDSQRASQSETRTSNSILTLSSEENPLTLCLKLHGTIYPCFLQQLDYDKSNCCDARKNSLLHLAALCYQPELTKLIIEKGALVNEVNKDENSCLSELLSKTEVSIERCKMDSMIAVVKELVEHDANVTMETESGMTMIQCASRFGDERLLLALLSKPSKFSNRINVTEEDYKFAFTKRWFEYAEVLVKVMSDKTLSTYITKDIIETSLTYANSNLTQLLFDRANANVQQSVIEDILYKAAMSEEENLFDHLKDVEIFYPKIFENGENLLTNLMKEKRIKYCIKLILSKNAQRFANTRNNNGPIPLQIAIELEELDVAELLVSKTTEINSENNQHETALMQLLKKISTCDSNMEHRLLMVIQSVIWMSASISVVTAEGCNVFDICKKPSLRADIEQFYKDNQFRRKPTQTSQESAVQICTICADNQIDCVLECGHPFCMKCADKLDKCAFCQREPVKYRRLYL